MTETITIPAAVIDTFGDPEAWALTVVSLSTLEEGTSWRVVGYTGALRQLERELVDRGVSAVNGEWRVFEFAATEVFTAEDDEVDATDRVVLAVAKGLVDA